jgi:hypothetical protein
VPVGRLKKYLRTNVEVGGLPISAISNLCLIPQDINKEKGEKTIYEYYKEMVEEDELSQEEANAEIEKIEKYSFTKKEDLDFITSLSKDNYLEFLKKRFATLKEKFYGQLEIS